MTSVNTKLILKLYFLPYFATYFLTTFSKCHTLATTFHAPASYWTITSKGAIRNHHIKREPSIWRQRFCLTGINETPLQTTVPTQSITLSLTVRRDV